MDAHEGNKGWPTNFFGLLIVKGQDLRLTTKIVTLTSILILVETGVEIPIGRTVNKRG